MASEDARLPARGGGHPFHAISVFEENERPATGR